MKIHCTLLSKEVKGIQIDKVVKLSLFADDMIIYWKDLKNSTPKLLDTINSFSNVAGYKISLQKSVGFLYTNNEQTKKEYRKTTPLKIASKKIKYLGINSTKDVNDLYKENYKSLKKGIKKTIKCGKISHVHGLAESTAKMAILQKQSTCTTQFPSKSQWHSS
jgi:hypothetical protein